MHRKRSNRRSIWFIKTPNHQPQSFGDFAHGHYTAVVHQVNLPFSYDYHRSKGTSLPHQPEETRIRHTGDEFARQTEWKKHKLCLCLSIPLQLHLLHRRNRKERRQAYSLSLYRRQWNPCHMDFDLVFQQVIDRQDRTS